MTDYEVLITSADRYRVQQYDADRAIESYERALDLGGPRDRYIQQMIGVCHQMLHNYAQALGRYEQALKGSDAHERGNILRDMAEAWSGMGRADRARQCLAEALTLLPASSYPSEHSVTLSFLARVEFRDGDLDSALRHYAESDAMLTALDDRHAELYGKLHFANALSAAGHWWRSRVMAARGLRLALRYGARPHKVRAVALLLGGCRLDNYVRNLHHR